MTITRKINDVYKVGYLPVLLNQSNIKSRALNLTSTPAALDLSRLLQTYFYNAKFDGYFTTKIIAFNSSFFKLNLRFTNQNT